MAIKEEDCNTTPESAGHTSLGSLSDALKHPSENTQGEGEPGFRASCSTASTSTSEPSLHEKSRHGPPEQCPAEGQISCASSNDVVPRNANASPQTAKHPKYALVDARRATMTTWPRDAFQDVEALVAAGFFYDGYKDRVICFSCGGALFAWDQNDDPLIEHVRWYPDCAYVKLCLGPQENSEIAQLQQAVLETKDEEEPNVKEIDDVIAKTIDPSCLEFYKTFSITQETFRKAVRLLLKKGVPIEDIQKSHIEKMLKEITRIKKNRVKVTKNQTIPAARNTCVLCLDDEKTVLFLPCQHLVSCVNCASAVSTCPMCRTPITSFVRAFFC